MTAGKSVLLAEYTTTTAAFCPTSAKLGLSSTRKRLALGAPAADLLRPTVRRDS